MSLPRAAPSEAGLPCVSCSFRTRVAESGHHSLKLFLRTGLHLGENQTRRLLSGIASFVPTWSRTKAARFPRSSPSTGGSPRSTIRW